MHFYHSQVIYVFLFFFSERSFRHGPFGLDCYRGVVLVAVLRYILRRYRNFIVVRERRQAGAASLSNPQLMPGRAAEQRREALMQLFRTAESAEDFPPIPMEELVRSIKKEPVTPPRAQSMPVLTPTKKFATQRDLLLV